MALDVCGTRAVSYLDEIRLDTTKPFDLRIVYLIMAVGNQHPPLLHRRLTVPSRCRTLKIRVGFLEVRGTRCLTDEGNGILETSLE